MATIAVDFDGTLFVNEDDDSLSLVPGAKEFMDALEAAGHTIVVHTCRVTEARNENEKLRIIKFLELAMDNHHLPYDSIYPGGKLIADAYVDDRSVEFRGNWGDVADRLNDLLDS